MSENVAKMTILLGLIRKEMNGEVVAAMQRHGLRYELNYGVSVPTVKKLAIRYAPDHQLAKYLYGQQARELKLAAFFVAEPEKIDIPELSFWAEGLVSSELAENFASAVLYRSPVMGDVVSQWLVDQADVHLQYAALIALAKSVDIGRCPVDEQQLRRIVEHYSASAEPLLRRGADTLEIRVG